MSATVKLFLLGFLIAGLLPQAALPQIASPFPLPVPVPTRDDPFVLAPPVPVPSREFREVDLLRRHTFLTARQAVASVRVTNFRGGPVSLLTPADLLLTVNGTPRHFTLQRPGTGGEFAPIVLLCFPPNQPIVHTIGLSQSRKFFSEQPPTLPWPVGILDSDGTMSDFTTDRARLLASFTALDHKVEPFQTSLNLGPSHGARWEGPWLGKAAQAINSMQVHDGPKLIVAFNPLQENFYGLNARILSYSGPESLIGIAAPIGASVYVANVGGPEVAIPGGDAAEEPGFSTPFQRSTLYTAPFSPAGVAGSLQSFGTNFALMSQTAQSTFGGFDNSLKDLGRKMQRDLDATYTLTFEMTPKDRDIGRPEVTVRPSDPGKRLLLTDVAPVSADPSLPGSGLAEAEMNHLLKAAEPPIASPDFRILQHIDYFPVQHGLAPVLPMSALVGWMGGGPTPRGLLIAEFVLNTALPNPTLERELDFEWKGRAVTWERDGHLAPGSYIWRIVLHDAAGNILASADRHFTVDLPQSPALILSSLVFATSCEANPQNPLRRRADLTHEDLEQPAYTLDPMRVGDCRARAEPINTFVPADTLRIFLRLYPAVRLERNRPEAWTVFMVVRSRAGAVELQQNTPLHVDTGTGLIASLQLPLTQLKIPAGEHTAEVHLKGPGIHKELVAQRPFAVVSP